MKGKEKLLEELLSSIKSHSHYSQDDAHLEVDGNKILASATVPGLIMDLDETENGIEGEIRLKAGTVIEKPVHLCFGMIPENGVQKINLNVVLEEDSKVNFLTHCTFPNAIELEHIMNSEVHVGRNASYTYFEKHTHSNSGGIKVIPKTRILLEEHAHFKTEFELIKGRVGFMDVDYRAECHDNSILDMIARISGRKDDIIKIHESGWLRGRHSRGVLASSIALRDDAKAEVFSELIADGDFAQGHVDCKEIIQDRGVARAVPIVQVNNPKAHVTHEAAIGSVDSKQLDTLMSRGVSEDDAVDMIIKGMLRRT
ncbi:MAG: SufBD protein [Spirochaetes bacterium]|nr:MAG: SufBD protein [Spirochaetota bacterium]